MVKVTLDASAVETALSTLVGFSNRSPEIVKHLINSHECLSKLFRIDVDRSLTAGADEVRAVLKPTDFLVHLLAALRAFEGDRVVTEVARHG
jgi:hypothetical protein